MSRAQLTSTVEQNSAGAAAPVVGGKNKIINGNCAIAQRGTSFTSPSAAYTLDRWCATPSAGGTTWSVSQVASFLTGSQYAIRTQRASGQTGTPAFYLGMAFESAEVIKLQGQTVTWSFYAKAGADFSASGLNLIAFFYTGTGTDQGPFTGHTGEVNQITAYPVLSKTVANRYSYTFTVPTNATSARWNLAFTPTGTAATNDYYDVTNMQLEIGSVATPFTTASGTLQGELALCMRYYCRWTDVGGYMGIAGMAFGSGLGGALTIPFPVPMRVQPTSVDYTQLSLYDLNGTYNFTSLTIQNATTNSGVLFASGASGITGYRPLVLISTSGTAYLGLSAEL